MELKESEFKAINELICVWNDAADALVSAKETYIKAYAAAFALADGKTADQRTANAKAACTTEHGNYKLAENALNAIYFKLQLLFVASGKQFVGPEIR